MSPAARPHLQDFTVSIPIPDHFRLKVTAASERRSMNAIVVEAVRNYMDLAGIPKQGEMNQQQAASR